MAQLLSQLREIPSDVYVECIDSQENVRLRKARKVFLPLKQPQIDVLSAIYEKWFLTSEALILKGVNLRSGEISFVGVKAAKRGNDVCSKRQNEKIQFLRTLRKDAQFFSIEDAMAGKALANVLWVTLTFDSKLCSLHEAWLHLSPRISSFIEGLKKRFGDVQHFLTPEVFPDPSGEAFGYPHVHMILLFKEQKFRVFPWLEKNEEGRETLSYRIQERDAIREAGDWHSFIEIKALRNASGVVGYCRKHMENTIQGESAQSFLNNAVMWLYRKKSYSMSQDFRGCFNEFITTMHVFPSLQLTLKRFICPKNKNGWGDWNKSHVKDLHQGEKGLSDLECSAEKAQGNAEFERERVVSSGRMDCSECEYLDQCRFSDLPDKVQEWSWEFLGVGSMERLGMKPWIWSQPLDPGVVQDELRRKRGRLFSDEY